MWSLEAVSKQGPLPQAALHREACTKLPASCIELPACIVFLPSASPYKGVSSWNCISAKGLRLSLPNQSHTGTLIYSLYHLYWSIKVLHPDQSGQWFLDKSNYEDLESSFVGGRTNQGPMVVTSESQPHSGSGRTLSLSTKYWRLIPYPHLSILETVT